MAYRFPFSPYPNGWFRAVYASELSVGQVLPLRRFGKDLVAFRDEEGQAHVLDAFCAHLGAHLGYGGTVKGKGIICPFHAWHWGGDGSCLAVPYASRIPPAARIRAWPVVERNGILWVWHHEQGADSTFEVPVLPEYGSDAWTPFEIRRWNVRSHWLDMNENAVDQAHFVYVHGTRTQPKTDATIDGHVLRCRSRMKMATPRGEIEGGIDTDDHGPGCQTVRVHGAVETLMLNTAVPIDEEYTDVSFAYSVNTAGGAEAARGVGAAIIRDLEKQMAQDIVIWEHKAYKARPVLCDGDGPFPVYRRWLRQFFSEQAGPG
jgi:phenylpropionate dioxygenase-like ring-hydroxylating dioxygenase large terminal subunit